MTDLLTKSQVGIAAGDGFQQPLVAAQVSGNEHFLRSPVRIDQRPPGGGAISKRRHFAAPKMKCRGAFRPVLVA